MALVLKRNGITRVRPLQGGLTLWMDRQFPVEELAVESRNGTLDTRAVTP